MDDEIKRNGHSRMMENMWHGRMRRARERRQLLPEVGVALLHRVELYQDEGGRLS